MLHMAYPKQLQRLRELLGALPGIGPRQATRLAHALREKDTAFLHTLAETVSSLPHQLATCAICFRTMEKSEHPACDICRSSSRDRNSILIVEKETDLEQFENAGAFTGMYHVLGGTVSPLDKTATEKLHMRELFERIQAQARHEKPEVILATSNTLDGNQTANYVARMLEPLQIRVTRLGRGLSTGAEIEYADPLTLDQALKNRK